VAAMNSHQLNNEFNVPGWLEILPAGSEYLDPSYYDRILPRYSFDGRRDLELLADFTKRCSTDSSILELGPGSGRATEVLWRQSQLALILVLI